jgi:hypothetical protein
VGITADSSRSAREGREITLSHLLHGMAPSGQAAPVTCSAHMPLSEIEAAVTDDEFAALNTTERDFALRWVRMTDEEQNCFCRNLLAAIELHQRLGVLEPPETADGIVPG